ncbi:MAG: hypothetical protein ABL909_05925 [Sphingopyxis sp.]
MVIGPRGRNDRLNSDRIRCVAESRGRRKPWQLGWKFGQCGDDGTGVGAGAMFFDSQKKACEVDID